MANVNKIILIGNLTRDPVLSHTPSNTPVVDFGMAINHRWRSADGQQKEDVCFIDIRAFGKQAEMINQYVKKGRQLYVEGRLTFDQWTGQDGQRRSKHRVTLDAFQFLDKREDGPEPRRPEKSEPEPAPAGADELPPF